MLKLILGRQLTNRTFSCLEIAKDAVLNKKSVVLLVPEQYSFECQRLLLKQLGPKTSNKIQIHSFTSLCDEIFSSEGGHACPVLDDVTKFLVLRNAVSLVKDNLRIYSKFYNSSIFIKKIMMTINELKQAGISIEVLSNIIKTLNSSLLSDKLSDISLIYSSYMALINNKFVDSNDIISRAIEKIEDKGYFCNKTIIVDGFKGFTATQFKLLERVIYESDDTYVSMCCDSLCINNNTEIFYNVKKSALKLIELAKKYGVNVDNEVCLNINSQICDEIKHFENVLSENNNDIYNKNTDNIKLVSALNITDEIDFVMSTIRRLVRTENYRYKDFVIISRNDLYKRYIEESAAAYKIPCFIDSKVILKSLPFSTFILSALEAALNYSTKDILKFLKTGLTDLSTDEVCFLENYTYVWGINGNKWLSKWDMNPDGLDADSNTANKEFIEKINQLRNAAIKGLYDFNCVEKHTVEDFCRAILVLFDKYNSIENLKQYTDNLQNIGHLQDAANIKTGYEVFMKMLDKIVAACGDDIVTLNEFSMLINSALEFETVGEIPQTEDEVVYGTADRIRPLNPKVVFTIGANLDVFPAAVSDTGLLTQSDRDVFLQNNYNIADCSISDCIDEKFIFYFSCCCATEKIFVTYSLSSASGGSLEPSLEVLNIKECFPNCFIENYSENNILVEFLETKEASFKTLAANYNSKNNIVNNLKYYFKNNTEYSQKIKVIDDFLSDKKFTISADTAKKLYGDNLYLSASKIDDFNSCRFMYFCKRGISALPLKKVEFDPLTRGNIIHFVLEKFINNHKDDIGFLDNDSIDNEVCQLCDEYLKTVVNDTDNLTDKFKYLFEVIKKSACYVCVALNAEFEQSDFKPKFCELKIGQDDGIDGISVTTNKGVTATVIGSVDRVDVTNDGKVRVVDYKTGGKKFELSKILDGLNVQMLLYLYNIIKKGKETLGADIPAGVLYFPANRNVKNESAQKYIKMNGIVLEDIETVKQMEKDGESLVVPAKFVSNGTKFSSNSSTVTIEGFDIIFKYLEYILINIADLMTSGDITANPIVIGKNFKCDYCDYHSVCRVNPEDCFSKESKGKTTEILDEMKKRLEDNSNELSK